MRRNVVPGDGQNLQRAYLAHTRVGGLIFCVDRARYAARRNTTRTFKCKGYDKNQERSESHQCSAISICLEKFRDMIGGKVERTGPEARRPL